MSDNIADIVGGDENTVPDAADTAAQDAAAANAGKGAEPAQKDTTAEEPKMVPLQALHEERARIKQMRSELEAERKARASDMEKLQKRLEILAKGPDPEPPAFEQDPASHLKYQLDSVQERLAQQQKLDQERQLQAEQQAAFQRLAQQIDASERHFVQQMPDYQDALKHLRESLKREQTEVFGLDEAQAAQRVERELLDFAIANAQRGANPAEAAYRIAGLRGYTKKAAAQTAQEKLETQQRGAAAKSLGGGGSPAKGLSIEALAAMSEDEFAKLTPEQWRKAMGG
jgi:chromosome segregation ATPase